MDYPTPIRREIINRLLAEELIINDPENRRTFWLGKTLMWSEGQCPRWQVLFNNFLKGNLPLPQERILSAWEGESLYLSDIFKRHYAWRNIIVGDGRGNFWLRIPPDIDLDLTQLPSKSEDDGSPPAPSSAGVSLALP
jgi:hypothetical protein